MSVKISGQVALVTGSNRGIGRALVEELLERGAAKVYATARDTSQLADLQAKYGDRLQPQQLDVTESEQLRLAAEVAGDVQVVFNNAGVAKGGDISDAGTLDAARTEMEVNYFGLLAMAQAFTPALKQGGALVNIVSIGGLTNFPFYPTYSASKAAAHSLTQAQRMLLKGEGISVHGVYPGPVDTDMARAIEMDKAKPNEVAGAILDALESGQEDIFPDVWAEGFGQTWNSSPKDSEREVASMLG